ncbi:ATP-binding protein [Actinobacillus arthritidis]|uniref:ATP-binding protein n=1 Tax=Actinobacillus arthritidis TaxID=157339 RepID=UPI0024431866|nr:ATP-binding protein [Actinobacillus arthritidis]WGE89101.1 putative DNA binding domain-containing protein [Actinobacillus arthritidis]
MSKFLDLNVLRFQKEGQYFDRKSARIRPRDILKHLVAFANANGGTLVIGIEDNGDISGFGVNGSHSIDEFSSIALIELRKTPILVKTERIPVLNTAGVSDEILQITVDVSSDRVIENYDNKVYLRQDDKSIELNFEQITQLTYDRGQRYFEDEIVEDSSMDDIDDEILAKYRALMRLDNLSILDILSARNFIKNGHLTHAGVLLFSKNPTKYLPQARLRVIKYDGNNAQVGQSLNIIKEKNFEGNIPKVISEVKSFVADQLREFQYLDHNGTFKIMPEYPEFAWFEGIVNALVHRNYAIRGDHIKVLIFDNRLEIHSPGLLPNIVTLQNMKTQRFSRNPRIARILSEFGWVKEMNEGVKRIYSEMENFYLKQPIYFEQNHSLILTLENNILNRALRVKDSLEALITSDTFNDLSGYEKEILSYIYTNKKITVKDGIEILNKSNTFVRNKFKHLEKLGILKWNGSNPTDPTQYYALAEKYSS